MTTTLEELLTTAEAAKWARRSTRTLQRMVEDGRLRGFRTHPRGPLLFRKEDLLAALGITEVAA